MSLYNFVWASTYSVLLQISLGMLIYFIFYAKKSELLNSFIFLHIMTLFWTLHSFLSVMTAGLIRNPEQASRIFRFLYGDFGIFIGGLSALSWLFFSLNYAGWKHRKKSRAYLLLSAPTILLYIGLLTNNLHHLFFTEGSENGILYWIHTFTSYSYAIAGFVVLLLYGLRQSRYERRRTFLLILAYLIPLITLLLKEIILPLAKIAHPFPFYISPAPFAFTIANLLISMIIAKYRFLNITSKAVNKIVHNLDQAVLILDASNKVVDFNRSFAETFTEGHPVRFNDNIGFLNHYIGRHMEDIPGNYAVLSSINSNEDKLIKNELILSGTGRKYYEVIVQPVHEHSSISGRIITFEDITAIKNVLEELEEKNETLGCLNEELIDKNRELKDYARTAEELAIMKERQRFSRDLHDTLGQAFTVLIIRLKMANILMKTDIEQAQSILEESIQTAREGQNELKKSILGLTPGSLETTDIKMAVAQLIRDFKTSGMKIDAVINGSYKTLSPDLKKALFRLCQEALTNSLRHGNADHVSIVLDSRADRIKVNILDNGCGSQNFVKGHGLTGMEERITGLGGTIRYGSGEEGGFHINAELPLSNTHQYIQEVRV